MKDPIELLKFWNKLLHDATPKAEVESVEKMVEVLAPRIAACPYSARIDQPGCAPGGLLECTLRVTDHARKLAPTFGLTDTSSDYWSLYRVCLLHDLGKIGDVEHDYWLPQTSEWHRDKLGALYMINENIPKATIVDRTLVLLQEHGIKLSRDEWLAIRLSSGAHLEENRFYVGAEPRIAIIVQTAKRLLSADFRE